MASGKVWHRIGPGSLVFLLSLFANGHIAEGSQRARPCPRCGWRAPRTKYYTSVRNTRELFQAIRRARPGTTILLEDGEYRLSQMLDIPHSNIVLRGKRGDPGKVVLRGKGMNDRSVPVLISISAPGVTVADLTAGHVAHHGVQIRGEKKASHAVLHNIRVVDTGQQLVKCSVGRNGLYADDCTVACSTLEYTNHAPSDYTNGVDVLAGKGWVVRDNRFYRIRGPRESNWKAGPAILFWANSRDTRVEKNLIVDCFRGIAFGLAPGISDAARDGEKKYDHQGGSIQNNVVVNLNSWADEGIEVNAARDVRIDHNTVFVEGRLPWCISIRFPETTGLARNNLTNRPVVLRDSARAQLKGNVSRAKKEWFKNLRKGDLRLARPTLPAVDAGVPIPGFDRDFARKRRKSGKAPDAGAYEYIKR